MKPLLTLLASLLFAAPAFAQMSGADFCQGQNVAKSSVPISITTNGSGEHQLVAAVANQQIQVCALIYDLDGGSPTLELDYGTTSSTPCDTNTTALTGAMSATTRTLGGSLDYITVPPRLCIVHQTRRHLADRGWRLNLRAEIRATMQITKNKPTSLQDALNDLGRALTKGRDALDDAISAVRSMQTIPGPPAREAETIEHCRRPTSAAMEAWSTLGEVMIALGDMVARG